MSSLGNDHTAAALALLADADGLTTYDGKAPPRNAAEYPHVVVYPDPGLSSTDRLSSARTDFTQVLQLTGVGVDRWQTQWALDAAAAVLDGVRPVIDGRSCWPIEQILARPITEDKDDPAHIVCFGVVQYRIHSTPA